MSVGARRVIKTVLLVVSALLLVVGALTYVFDPSTLSRYTELEARLTKVRAMNRALIRENEQLVRRIDAFRHDPRYLERLARQEMGLIRDGQEVYLFPSETPPASLLP